MIYKFQELKEPFSKFIEFQELEDGIQIEFTDEISMLTDYCNVKLDKEQLFELIGCLLRIQSKLKK